MMVILAALSRWLTQPKNLALVGVGVLMLALAVQTLRLNHAKHDLTAARAALINPTTKNTWRADFGSCQTALGRQNAAVAAMKADGDRRAAELSEALQRASVASQTASQAAARILAIKPPRGDTCARLLAVEAAISREYQQ